MLTIKLRVYGTRDHYSTAMTEVNLAVLLLQTGGKPQRARELLAHALQVFHTQLGPDHPYTRKLLDSLRLLAKNSGPT